MDKLGDMLRYADMMSASTQRGLKHADPFDGIRDWTPEEKAKLEADNRAQLKEQERKNWACAIINIAESLVVTQNLQPEQAIDTAETLTKLSRSFVKNWKLWEE